MSGVYSVRGLELAYETWGERNNPTLLFLHGYQDHGLSYARTANYLQGEYFVIAPDLRGHGRSGWVGDGGEYYFYDYVYDVLCLLEHLGVDKLAIVGHSMGGNVATFSSALLKERVTSLILLEGMGFEPHDLADSVNRLTRWSSTLKRAEINGDRASRKLSRQRMKDLEEAAERLRRYNSRLSLEHSLELAQTFSEPSPDGNGVMWRFDPLHKTPSAKPYVLEEAAAIWSSLSMPVLSLYGSESPWFPGDLKNRLARMKDVRSGIVEGAGHNIHHDRADVLARAIRGHLLEPNGAFPQGIRAGLPPLLESQAAR